jgi:hypothetical protein
LTINQAAQNLWISGINQVAIGQQSVKNWISNMQQSGTNWNTNMIPIRLPDWCQYLANIGYQSGCLIGIRLEESVANQSPIR